MVNDFQLIRHLFFDSEKLLLAVKKEVQSYSRDDRTVVEALWKGALYKPFIDEGFVAEHTLEWISEAIGYGLFAAKSYKKGGFIGEYVGEVKRFLPLRCRRNDYIGELRVAEHVPLRFILDSEKKGNMTRFINHSDTPNLKSMTVISSGLLHAIFVANQDIAPGQQFCYNYGPTYWRLRCKEMMPP